MLLRRIQNSKHLKNKYLAPASGVVLAGAFAGTLALAPMDGGSGASEQPRAAVPAKAQEKIEPQAAKPVERGPAKPPADCDPSDTSALKYSNGRIPAKALCPLPGKGESLRADAAMAFYKLNEAYYKRFGKDITVNSSYRSYAKQSQLYRTMTPGMAARPGTSNHGNGIALDMGGGVQRGSSPQFKWMEDNAGKYGWIHPAWAYSNPYEPWHWEYKPGSRSR